MPLPASGACVVAAYACAYLGPNHTHHEDAERVCGAGGNSSGTCHANGELSAFRGTESREAELRQQTQRCSVVCSPATAIMYLVEERDQSVCRVIPVRGC